MPQLWHTHAMTRIRISTTVDSDLLNTARSARGGVNDARLLDEALGLLVAQHQRAEIDAAIAQGYARHPIDEPDEWGNLVEFIDAVRARGADGPHDLGAWS